MSNELYVYANSYPGIVEAFRHSIKENIVFISSNKSIQDMCERLQIKLIWIGEPENLSLTALRTHKSMIKERMNRIKNKTVLFCFYGFDLFGLYAINLLQKNNSLFFNNKDNCYPKYSHFKYWKRRVSVFNYIIYRFLLKIPIRQFEITPDRCFFGLCYVKLQQTFPELKSTDSHKVFLENNLSIRESIGIEKKSKLALFVDSGNFLFTLKQEFFDQLSKVTEGCQLFVKPHPNFPISNQSLLKYNILDKSLPAELIIDEQTILIGINSTTIFNVNAFQVKKISLINFVDWKDMDEEKRCRERIEKDESIVVLT